MNSHRMFELAQALAVAKSRQDVPAALQLLPLLAEPFLAGRDIVDASIACVSAPIKKRLKVHSGNCAIFFDASFYLHQYWMPAA